MVPGGFWQQISVTWCFVDQKLYLQNVFLKSDIDINKILKYIYTEEKKKKKKKKEEEEEEDSKADKGKRDFYHGEACSSTERAE